MNPSSDKGIHQIFEPIPFSNQYVPVDKTYKSHRTDIADFIGYGFKVKFLKNFYLNQSIGIGIRYYSSVSDYEDTKYSSYQKDTELGVLLKLGLGYTFDYKIKKLNNEKDIL